MPRRRIEMVVEQDEIILVRSRRGAVRMSCSQCEAQVPCCAWKTPVLSPGRARSICRWIEAGKLHFAESGLLLICTQSLATLVSAERPVERKRNCYIGKDDSVPDGGHL
jgi:hypothetical protein